MYSRTGSYLKDRCSKILKFVWNVLPKKVLEISLFSTEEFLSTWIPLQHSTEWLPCCSWEPGNTEPLNATLVVLDHPIVGSVLFYLAGIWITSPSIPCPGHVLWHHRELLLWLCHTDESEEQALPGLLAPGCPSLLPHPAPSILSKLLWTSVVYLTPSQCIKQPG